MCFSKDNLSYFFVKADCSSYISYIVYIPRNMFPILLLCTYLMFLPCLRLILPIYEWTVRVKSRHIFGHVSLFNCAYKTDSSISNVCCNVKGNKKRNNQMQNNKTSIYTGYVPAMFAMNCQVQLILDITVTRSQKICSIQTQSKCEYRQIDQEFRLRIKICRHNTL